MDAYRLQQPAQQGREYLDVELADKIVKMAKTHAACITHELNV